MSMSNDIVGPDYEPYGWLAIDIGHRTDNQNVTLWHVEKNDYLSIEYGVILQLHFLCAFQESEDFLLVVGDTGDDHLVLTLRGEVLERDGSNKDLLGRYEGHNFTASQMRNGATHLFPGKIEDGAYVKIDAQIFQRLLEFKR